MSCKVTIGPVFMSRRLLSISCLLPSGSVHARRTRSARRSVPLFSLVSLLKGDYQSLYMQRLVLSILSYYRTVYMQRRLLYLVLTSDSVHAKMKKKGDHQAVCVQSRTGSVLGTWACVPCKSSKYPTAPLDLHTDRHTHTHRHTGSIQDGYEQIRQK